MPQQVRSPITSRRDSAPAQPAGRDEKPEPNLPVEGRSDAITTAVEGHLARHAMLRLGREED
jgi:hypothetical protein